jgi:hypothetical protein
LDYCRIESAYWIYYENGDTFYCEDCIDKRVEEINANKEFAEEINYEDGDECGYSGGEYANVEYEATCEMCGRPLFSNIDYE